MRAASGRHVLIALLDADHSLHDQAMHWFRPMPPRAGLRVPSRQNDACAWMSGPGYPGPLPVSVVVERLAEATPTSSTILA